MISDTGPGGPARVRRQTAVAGIGRKRSQPKGVKARVDAQRADVARMRAEGMTLLAIGERIGLSRQRVGVLLKPAPPNHCRACGGEIERQKRFHPACRPSNYKPTGRPRATRRHDLTGRRFGLWTVLGIAGAGRWLCRCRCGVERAVFTNSLRAGTSRGCRSCRAKERHATKQSGGKA